MTNRTTTITNAFGTFVISKVVVREAYARNGNAHNPTKEYAFIALRNGREEYRARTKKKVVEAINTWEE